ncbi:MAG TPA: PTS sugar transporter subunit IIA [Anaerolineae bacterium]|nr:PTS sugar transporter subunit IIA [Anaerolineae bacterium]
MANGHKDYFFDLEISEKMTFVNLDSDTADEVIKVLGKSLEKQGKVQPTYIDAVIAREEKMPTGILTMAGGVAIPHTDTKYVLQSAIAVGLLESPVNFHNIASPTEILQVDLVFLLAIARVESVTKVLSALGELLQDKDSLEQLKAMTDPTEVVQFLSKNLKNFSNRKQS